MDDYVYRKAQERQNKWKKQRRERRRQNGICTRCGKTAAEDGYVTCNYCRTHMEKSNHNAYWERKAKGICVVCGIAPARDNRTCCFVCAIKNTERLTANYYKRRGRECQS